MNRRYSQNVHPPSNSTGNSRGAYSNNRSRFDKWSCSSSSGYENIQNQRISNNDGKAGRGKKNANDLRGNGNQRFSRNENSNDGNPPSWLKSRNLNDSNRPRYPSRNWNSNQYRGRGAGGGSSGTTRVRYTPMRLYNWVWPSSYENLQSSATPPDTESEAAQRNPHANKQGDLGNGKKNVDFDSSMDYRNRNTSCNRKLSSAGNATNDDIDPMLRNSNFEHHRIHFTWDQEKTRKESLKAFNYNDSLERMRNLGISEENGTRSYEDAPTGKCNAFTRNPHFSQSESKNGEAAWKWGHGSPYDSQMVDEEDEEDDHDQYHHRHNDDKSYEGETVLEKLSGNTWQWPAGFGTSKCKWGGDEENAQDSTPKEDSTAADVVQIRRFRKLSRSPVRQIARKRIDDSFPRRNFGDYDPVRPRYLPKSAGFKSHLSSKDQGRRVIYKGISEHNVRHEDYCQPFTQREGEEEDEEKEEEKSDWRKELDAKYDAKYGTELDDDDYDGEDAEERKYSVSNFGEECKEEYDYGAF